MIISGSCCGSSTHVTPLCDSHIENASMWWDIDAGVEQGRLTGGAVSFKCQHSKGRQGGRAQTQYKGTTNLSQPPPLTLPPSTVFASTNFLIPGYLRVTGFNLCRNLEQREGWSRIAGSTSSRLKAARSNTFMPRTERGGAKKESRDAMVQKGLFHIYIRYPS